MNTTQIHQLIVAASAAIAAGQTFVLNALIVALRLALCGDVVAPVLDRFEQLASETGTEQPQFNAANRLTWIKWYREAAKVSLQAAKEESDRLASELLKTLDTSTVEGQREFMGWPKHIRDMAKGTGSTFELAINDARWVFPMSQRVAVLGIIDAYYYRGLLDLKATVSGMKQALSGQYITSGYEPYSERIEVTLWDDGKNGKLKVWKQFYLESSIVLCPQRQDATINATSGICIIAL